MEKLWIIQEQISLAGSAEGIISYNVPQNVRLEVYQWGFKPTGNFDIISIEAGDGNFLSNSNANAPIPHEAFYQLDTPNLALFPLPIAVMLAGNDNLILTVKDTSTSPNIIRFTAICKWISNK